MAQVGNPNALATLLRLSGPSNVRALPGPRGLDIASGMDQFEPSENELKTEQASNPLRSGPFTSYRSRDSIRDDAMSQVRKALGLGEIQHQQKVEQAERPVRLRGEYDLAEADRNIEAEMIGRQTQQDAIRERQQEQRDFQAQQNELSRTHAATLQEDRQAQPTRAAAPRVTDSALKRLEESRGGGGLWGMLRPSSRNSGILSSLSSVLEQKGKLQQIASVVDDARRQGETAQQVLASAQAEGITLDPHEVEFIRLSLGQ